MPKIWREWRKAARARETCWAEGRAVGGERLKEPAAWGLGKGRGGVGNSVTWDPGFRFSCAGSNPEQVAW